MKEILNITKDMYTRFQGSGNHFLLFWISLFGLILWNQKNNKKINLFLIVYSILLMIIFVCPITAKIIIDYCIGSNVYWRMLWLLPYVLIIAYSSTNIIFEMHSKGKKLTAFFGLLLLITSCGTNIYSLISIDPTAGAAKIPNNVEVICEELLQHSEQNSLTEINAVMPDDLTPYVRQYNASIHMPYGRYAPGNKTSIIHEILYAETINYNRLKQSFINDNCNYLVWYNTENDTEIACLELMGFELISQIDSYNIFYFSNTDSLKVAQFSDITDTNAMFYIIADKEGRILVVDGGNPGNTEYVISVIASLGNRIDTWILTHPHIDHIGVFCTLLETERTPSIDKIYTVDMAPVELCKQNASWDDFTIYEKFLNYDIPNLTYLYEGDIIFLGEHKIEILSAYNDYIDEISSDLVNDGSMMFKVYGKEESMLFCSDIGKSMSDYLKDKYSTKLPSEYIQMGHHDNGGLKEDFYRLVNPKVAFFDAPEWLMNPEEESEYTTPQNQNLMKSLGSEIYYFANSPTTINLY